MDFTIILVWTDGFIERMGTWENYDECCNECKKLAKTFEDDVEEFKVIPVSQYSKYFKYFQEQQSRNSA